MFLAGVMIFAGCAAPQIVWRGETTVRGSEGSVIYSNLNVRRGEIVYRGLPSVASIVEVSLDGRRIGDIHSGGWMEWTTDTIGRHFIEGIVYLVERNRVTNRIGCFRQEFDVSPYYRTSGNFGLWWRVDIYSSPHC